MYNGTNVMDCICPACQSNLTKKNGHIHNGKQNHRCLSCGRQFVLNPTQKIIDQQTREQIKKALLERISLEGVCRVFGVSMPWLLKFIEGLIVELPQNLNAEVVTDGEIEVVLFEADEQWSFVGSKKNPQWLWLIMHKESRQVVAMEVGPRNKKTAQNLLDKLPEPLKKKLSTTLTTFLCTMKQSHRKSTGQSEKIQVRLRTLRELTAPYVSAAQGW